MLAASSRGRQLGLSFCFICFLTALTGLTKHDHSGSQRVDYTLGHGADYFGVLGAGRERLLQEQEQSGSCLSSSIERGWKRSESSAGDIRQKMRVGRQRDEQRNLPEPQARGNEAKQPEGRTERRARATQSDT
ncbi:unnamed protein product [Pleuronectes platessa]|uniref:Uncharacterized protein n=1 Tax=Pleuronectes platessa TaxID=8262 RepID=A0A9N7YNQ5_PLEPL|nr:unnamed protein product [Pleuronectes platessa]